MHSSGPLAWPGPHTVGGGGGGPPAGGATLSVCSGAGELELLSAAPRMTPTTTRAAPTEAQPAQARCVLSHRRQPGPDPAPLDGRGGGLGGAGSWVYEAELASSPLSSGAGSCGVR